MDRGYGIGRKACGPMLIAEFMGLIALPESLQEKLGDEEDTNSLGWLFSQQPTTYNTVQVCTSCGRTRPERRISPSESWRISPLAPTTCICWRIQHSTATCPHHGSQPSPPLMRRSQRPTTSS